MVDGVRGETVARRRVRAHVGQERAVHADDGAVAREAHANLVLLLAIVPGGQEMLAPAFHPLHRAAEAPRGRGDQHFLGIDAPLGAEAATHVGHEDAHFLGGQAERRRDHVAHGVQILRRGPHDQRPAPST